MITSCDLEAVELFAGLRPIDREELANKAGDVRRIAGEFVSREGEDPSFWILLHGQVTVTKTYGTRVQEMASLEPGTFFGEIPILLGTKQIASIRADVDCRLARLDIASFRSLLQEHPQCFSLVEETFTKRIALVNATHKKVTATRVVFAGAHPDEETREIRHFLDLNRITYAQVDEDSEHMPVGMTPPAVIVDGVAIDTGLPAVNAIATALGMRTQPAKKEYDLVVVGGGPAGLAAAVYGASEGLDVLLVERFAAGGQAGTSTRIENYLGFPEGISGDDLAERALRQAERLGAEIVVTHRVNRLLAMTDRRYCCELDDDTTFSGRAIVLATGVSWRCFKAQGVERLRGRGVLYGSAKTEASAVIGKDVFIVGGGNSAGQAAVYFADYANSVTILVRGSGLAATMSQYLIDQLLQKSNVSIEAFTEVISVQGKEILETIKTVKRNPETNDVISRGRRADALFILIGATAQTEWLPSDLLRDEHGFICTGQDTVTWASWKEPRQPYPLETSLPGVFCVGDVRHDSVKRVAAGVGEGSMVINFVHKYLALANSPRLTA